MHDINQVVAAPKVLTPRTGLNLFSWAVVACDQFTSDPAYWESVEQTVGAQPSTLNMILPEVHLGESEEATSARIRAVNQTMEQYLDEGILTEQGPCLVLIRRDIPGEGTRTGLLLCIDLEQYEFEPGNRAPIRASEGTVLERIPPRVRIRENAPVELPHVLLLIDDPERTVLEPLADRCSEGGFPLLYDTPLMLGGGRVRGYRIPADELPISALTGLPSWTRHGLLMAVGDGNHSLVTAKACWENLRESGAGPDHPARYAMVEVINLYDTGLHFEPIHRVLFRCPMDAFLHAARAQYAPDELHISETTTDVPPDSVRTVSGDRSATLTFSGDRLAADWLQPVLDAVLEQLADASIDYIHGEQALRSLAGDGHTGLLLPALRKDRFFDDLVGNGVYPRKTFSMGEAEGKRYYIEARRLR